MTTGKRRKLKLVISPGLARSGTTYLYHSLSDNHPYLFNFGPSKELNFFDTSCDPKAFRALFDAPDDNKYYVDYSPAYLCDSRRAVDNIAAFPAQEKKIILHLRHPVDQLFAHYLHDIKAHYAMRQFDKVHSPLFSETITRNYMALRGRAVEQLVNNVGLENILVVNFHKDLAAPDLHTRVGRFLDLDLAPFRQRIIGGGGWLPYYIYAHTEPVDVAIGANVYALPPHHLLLVNNAESCIWPDIDPETALQVLAGATTWSRQIVPAEFDILYEAFREDWLRTLTLLGQHPDDYGVARHMIPRQASLPESMAVHLYDPRPIGGVLKASASQRGTGG